METGLVELRVRGIALDGPEGSPLVVLEDRERCRRVELPAGPFEASAIIMELEGMTPPRPRAHDLLADPFREGGFSLDEVVLAPAEGEAPVLARLDYRKGQRRLSKQVQPADAIALALRLRSPIAADPSLFESCGRRARILRLEDWRERAVGA